ncbi:hypothetical protein EGJ27_19435 [Pseudomonas sp. v388]|nr:hypothetical protein EGJ27_19435 [Pseudomonas sp. v388]
MPELETNQTLRRKVLAWIVLFGVLAIALFFYLIRPQYSPEIVLKQPFIPGQWVYVMRNGHDASEPSSLRFYIDDVEASSQVMSVRLGKKLPFLVSDTALEDVAIQKVANGLKIQIRGAVQSYRSDLYLADGDTYTTFRVSLDQRDDSAPKPSGR